MPASILAKANVTCAYNICDRLIVFNPCSIAGSAIQKPCN